MRDTVSLMNSITRRVCSGLMIVAVAAVSACGGGDSAGTPGGAAAQINGAGATFPYPIYSKWFSEYTKSHPDVRINYQSIGSGGVSGSSRTRRSSSEPPTAP